MYEKQCDAVTDIYHMANGNVRMGVFFLGSLLEIFHGRAVTAFFPSKLWSTIIRKHTKNKINLVSDMYHVVNGNVRKKSFSPPMPGEHLENVHSHL